MISLKKINKGVAKMPKMYFIYFNDGKKNKK